MKVKETVESVDLLVPIFALALQFELVWKVGRGPISNQRIIGPEGVALMTFLLVLAIEKSFNDFLG